MQSQYISLNKLLNNDGQIDGLPKNPRTIDDSHFKKLVKSIEDDPEMLELRELLVYPFGDNYIVIGGNMRLRAMHSIGFSEAPCKVIDKDVPVEKLRAYLIKDNVSGGDWDYDLIANEWDNSELIDFGMDLNFEAIDELIEEEHYSDEDNIPEVATPKTKLGDVWLLGKHRLMCGDSFDVQDIEKLTQNANIDIIFTDPMYNDSPDFFIGSLYCINSNNILLMCTMKQAINLSTNSELKFRFDTVLYFRTPSSSMNKKVPYYNHKNIIYLTKNNETIFNCDNATGTFSDRGFYPSVIEAKKNTQEVHGMTKPVDALVEILSGYKCKTVIDLFAGSGSILLACVKTNRINYSMELDPKYCDVIIKRWQEYTKKDAILESTQQKYNQI